MEISLASAQLIALESNLQANQLSGIAKQDSNLIFVSSTIVLGNVIGIYVGSS
jgi:hypothetical protein